MEATGSCLIILAAAAMPTIVVTSRVDEEMDEEATRRGANAFIAKPFKPAELQMVLRSSAATRGI